MNRSDDHFSGDDRRFDLLVDGELAEAERRELLASLDQTPGGWRHCALAFLEAQCWKEPLGAMASPPAPTPPPQPAAGPRQRSWWSAHFGTLLAMAASFLLALLVGSQLPSLRQMRSETGRPGSGQVAERQPNGQPAPWPQPSLPQPDSGLPSRGWPDSSWRMVTLSMPEGTPGADRVIAVPAHEQDSVDEQWLRAMPSAVPADVLQAFRRTGHRVLQRREWMPLELSDGRRLLVPVDQVEVHYVGRPAY